MVSRSMPVSIDEALESSWWFALCEALHALDDGASGIQSIAAGQSQGAATHLLSTLIAEVLRQHYRMLFDEAEQWLG